MTKDGSDWSCCKCGALTDPQDLNRRETEMATAMAELNNFKVVEFEKYHESLSHLLHPNHYLMVLLKRHMVGLYSTVLTELEAEDLERVSDVTSRKEKMTNILRLKDIARRWTASTRSSTRDIRRREEPC